MNPYTELDTPKGNASAWYVSTRRLVGLKVATFDAQRLWGEIASCRQAAAKSTVFPTHWSLLQSLASSRSSNHIQSVQLWCGLHLRGLVYHAAGKIIFSRWTGSLLQSKLPAHYSMFWEGVLAPLASVRAELSRLGLRSKMPVDDLRPGENTEALANPF